MSKYVVSPSQQVDRFIQSYGPFVASFGISLKNVNAKLDATTNGSVFPTINDFVGAMYNTSALKKIGLAIHQDLTVDLLNEGDFKQAYQGRPNSGGIDASAS